LDSVENSGTFDELLQAGRVAELDRLEAEVEVRLDPRDWSAHNVRSSSIRFVSSADAVTGLAPSLRLAREDQAATEPRPALRARSWMRSVRRWQGDPRRANSRLLLSETPKNWVSRLAPDLSTL
jgi:hypothetical protein